MSREEAIQKVYEVLHEMLPELDSINEDIDMLDDLGLLDLDLIEVQLMLEEKFSIQLDDRDTDAIGEGQLPSRRLARQDHDDPNTARTTNQGNQIKWH